jgi:hypothetical protein
MPIGGNQWILDAFSAQGLDRMMSFLSDDCTLEMTRDRLRQPMRLARRG